MSDDISKVPRFPPVPAELLEGSPRREVVLEFLTKVEDWRWNALAWLTGPEYPAHLSSELAELMRAALGDNAARWSPIGARWVRPYPELDRTAVTDASSSAAEHRRALDILVWRSILAYFLADAWDTPSPPIFEMEECGFADEVLLSPPVTTMRQCPDCLQGLAEGHVAAHYDVCVVRLRRDRPPGE